MTLQIVLGKKDQEQRQWALTEMDCMIRYVSLSLWTMTNQHRKAFCLALRFCFWVSVLWVKSYSNKWGTVSLGKKTTFLLQPLNSNLVEKRAPPSAKCYLSMLKCLHMLCLLVVLILVFSYNLSSHRGSNPLAARSISAPGESSWFI